MSDFSKIQEREKGLEQNLTSRQMTMIAIGGAIGTGLFLGSKTAIGLAGPSVVISYIIAGAVALALMAVLAEMTVRHPTSGSFGAYAEHYVGPLAGFQVRYLYWLSIVLAVGAEVTAIGTYMQLWFPLVNPTVWVVLFSAILILVNAMNVKNFGTLEYWLSTIKVFAIIAFIIVGAWLLFFSGNEGYGTKIWAGEGGFFPNGISGMWFAVIMAFFSYLSIEMIAVAAGEAKEPEAAVKKAFKATVLRLFVFYLLTLSLIVSIVSTSTIMEGTSPFVTVMNAVGLPFADDIINFVVIVAALSAMNSQLYVSTRMMFSLARAGDAPKSLGRLSTSGAPINALAVSTLGIFVAAVVSAIVGDDAFLVMVSISMFGALFTWLMIFVTHFFFRKRMDEDGVDLEYKIPFSRGAAILGALTLSAILITTLFTEEFRPTLFFGVAVVLIVTGLFYLFRRRDPALTEDEFATDSAGGAEESTESDPGAGQEGS